MQIRKNFVTKIILATLFITLSTSLCFNFALARLDEPEARRYLDEPSSPGGQVQLQDPLNVEGGDLNKFIGRIIKNILGVVGSIALVMFVIGGIMWMTSGGSETRVKKGKDILTWAAMGLVIIFTSYAILKFVLDVLTKQNP